MAKKVLIFAPFGQWIVHTQLDCVLGSALKNRGCDVKVLACDGIFDQCYIVGSPPDPERCTSCQAQTKAWFSRFGLEVVQMRELLSEEDWAEAKAWAEQVPLEDLDHEASFFDKRPIARWMRPATHSFLRTGTIDFTELRSISTARHLLTHGALISRAVSRCLESFPADISTCYSGSNSYYRVFFEMLRSSGALPLVHERGSVDGSFFIATGIPTYELSIRKPADWAIWKDVPLSEPQLQTVIESYANRAEGKNTNFQVIHQFRTEGARIRHRLRLPGGKKIVLAMCSGDWEFGMFSSFGGLSVLWKRQFDWLRDTAELCRERGWLFVIRQHPLGAGKKTYPRATAFLSEMIGDHPWLAEHVRMIMPAENLSSYDLFEIADVVVAQFSRTVAEAYSRGVPAICVTNNTLAHMGIPVVQSREEYPALLEQMMAQAPCVSVDALRLAYRWSNFRFFVLGSSLFDSVRIKNVYEPDFRRQGPEDLQPGTDTRLDEVCEHLLNGAPLYPKPAHMPSLQAETAWITQHRKQIVARRLEFQRSLVDPEDPEVLVLHLGQTGVSERGRCRHRQVRHQHLTINASSGPEGVLIALSEALAGVTSPYVQLVNVGMRLDESAIARAVDALENAERATAGGVLFGCYALTKSGVIGPEWNTATFAPVVEDLPPAEIEALTAPLTALSLVLWRREKLIPWLQQTTRRIAANVDRWSAELLLSFVTDSSIWNLAEPAVFLEAVESRAELLKAAKLEAYQQRYGRRTELLEQIAGQLISSKEHEQALPLVRELFLSGQGGRKAWSLLVRALPEVVCKQPFAGGAVEPASVRQPEKLRFMQLHTFYSAYLARHYAAHPALLDAPFAEQQQAMLADGFGAAHMWAPVLASQGHEARLIIANDVVSQFRWVSEHLDKLKLKKKSEWMQEIALEQVNRFQPEVLYLGDPVAFDMTFVRRLKHRPKQVIAWRAAPTPAGVDWKGIDLMLSHLPPCQKQAWRAGVRDVRFFYPGFCQWVADAVKDEPKEYDLVFCGQWSDDHEKRNNLIAKLAKASLDKQKPFSFGLFLECADPSKLPDSVRKLNQGGLWGMDMYRALKRGRLALNAEINMGRGHAGNMRLFEATGIGTCLLTEHHGNISRYFEPGREVLTFSRAEDCLQTLHHHLQDEAARDAIARAGQQRCLGEHAIERRMETLTQWLQHPARGPMAWARRSWHRLRG